MGWQDWLFCYLLLQSVQAATLPWRIWPATLITHDSRPPAIDWTRCDRDFDDELLNRLQRSFDCARVPVPLDYTNEYSSQPLLLDLVRVNANRHPYKGSVIFNPGGPGGSGVSYVILKGGMLRKFIGGHYDIIGFDPRGAGRTLNTSCDGIFDRPLPTASPAKKLESDIYMEDGADWESIKNEAWQDAGVFADACYKNNADTGRFYGTPYVARDIVKIADALGQGSKINYWGVSYGTILGQVLAAMFPERVGRMLLDGNLLADEHFAGTWKSSTKDTEKAILHFFSNCIAAGPQSCSLASNYSTIKSLVDAYNELQRLYHEDDILSHSIGKESSKEDWFERSVFAHLYSVARYPELVSRLKGALEGNETAAFLPIDNRTNSRDRSAFLMIACGDSSFRADSPDDLFSFYQAQLNQGPFGDTVALNRFQCARWKFRAAEQVNLNSLLRIKPDRPVLIVNGIYDPVTPLISAWEVSTRFPGSRVVVHEGAGHSSMSHPSSCIKKIVARYFNSGLLPEVNTTCKPDLSAFEVVEALGTFANPKAAYPDSQ